MVWLCTDRLHSVGLYCSNARQVLMPLKDHGAQVIGVMQAKLLDYLFLNPVLSYNTWIR